MNKQDITKTQGIAYPQRQSKEALRKRLLTVPEAAIYLGRSVPSIRELIWSGNLPIVREGRRIHLDIFDLDKWIDTRKTRYTY